MSVQETLRELLEQLSHARTNGEASDLHEKVGVILEYDDLGLKLLDVVEAASALVDQTISIEEVVRREKVLLDALAAVEKQPDLAS